MDVDEAAGFFWLLVIVVFLGVYIYACQDCTSSRCSPGKRAVMYEYTCMCVETPVHEEWKPEPIKRNWP